MASARLPSKAKDTLAQSVARLTGYHIERSSKKECQLLDPWCELVAEGSSVSDVWDQIPNLEIVCAMAALVIESGKETRWLEIIDLEESDLRDKEYDWKFCAIIYGQGSYPPAFPFMDIVSRTGTVLGVGYSDDRVEAICLAVLDSAS